MYFKTKGEISMNKLKKIIAMSLVAVTLGTSITFASETDVSAKTRTRRSVGYQSANSGSAASDSSGGEKSFFEKLLDSLKHVKVRDPLL